MCYEQHVINDIPSLTTLEETRKDTNGLERRTAASSLSPSNFRFPTPAVISTYVHAETKGKKLDAGD